MNNPLERDVYYYGSMRDYKHRVTLKNVDWGNKPESRYIDILAAIGFIMALLLIIII